MPITSNTNVNNIIAGLPGVNYTPRLSTPGPVTEPRWPGLNTGYDFQSMSDLLAAQNDLSYLNSVQGLPKPSPPVPKEGGAGLTLALPSAKAQSEAFVDYAVDKRAASEFEAMLAKKKGEASAALKSAQGAYTGGKFTGSYGPKGYGFYGTTGTAGTKGSAQYGLQPEFWQALGAANAAMKAAGLGTFSITGGWRSYEGQVTAKAKWTKLGNPSAAATPGNSVHGIGYAADLGLTSKQWQWLYQNGSKYGLWGFPGVTKSTQIESWHWQMLPSLAKPPWAS